MIFLTTTAIDLDEELLNRCLVLTVDEEGAQTQAIHQQQREQQTIEGFFAKCTGVSNVWASSLMIQSLNGLKNGKGNHTSGPLE